MWTIPNGWRVEHKGDAMVLVAVSGGARIVAHEGLRPVGDLHELVAAACLPRFEVDERSIERLVTCEGERGVVMTGRAGGVAIELGFVLLDDTYVRIVGHGSGASSVVRQLVVGTRAFLGSTRRRRFWYRTPPGWKRVNTGSGDDVWLAPKFPDDRASITVPRAMPIGAREQLSVVRDLLGMAEALVAVPPSTSISTRRGLTGSRWTRLITSDDGVELELVVVALTDGSYDYCARALVPRGQLAAFEELLESIEPVPAFPRPQAVLQTALGFWVA